MFKLSTTVTCPPHANKIIYWNEKDKRGRAFILVGYCPDTLEYFLAIFEEAKKSYPELTLGEVICSKVKESGWCKGFTLITFSVKTKAKGWLVGEYDKMDIRF